MFRSSVLFLAPLLTACSEYDFSSLSESPPADVDETSSPGQGSGLGDPVQTSSVPEEVETVPEDDCDHTSDLIYVIDRTEESLYLFDPMTLRFDFVGRLDCGAFSGTPSSMSISRTGFAYVRYSDLSVYAVNLKTMACTETAYNRDFGPFGMGYATQDADTWQDDLYVANDNRLAHLDTKAWSLTEVGSMASQAELTGNAEGELWAFLPLEQPAELIELDKVTGDALTTHRLTTFPDPYDLDTFAFATWGGEFWLFVRFYGMGHTTDVYRVTADGILERVESDTGMDVVGAGVSTCAPSE